MNSKDFQQLILSWWEKNRRDLPWRNTRDPYRIFVSEVMLQQTQVDRVLPKYLEFIEAYPTVFELAGAALSDVITRWKGLGYNRRAVYLKKTAEAVVEKYGGTFPKTQEELEKLPGIGKYTASAICCFAYEQDVVVVDTNVRQIIEHFFFTPAPTQSSQLSDQPLSSSVDLTLTLSYKERGITEKEVYDMAQQLVPKGKSWDWHQALMDYGSLALPKKKVSRKKEVFEESRRYFRGRIIDYLRTGEKKYVDIEKYFNDLNQQSTKKYLFEDVIKGLERDGLVATEGSGKTSIVRLPS